MTETNPTNYTNRLELTTKSLGIADAKAQDLGGYILRQRDVEYAVIKVLVAVGIDQDEIRCVKVGGTKERQLRIIVELSAKALNKNKGKRNNGVLEFRNLTESKESFDPKFYAATHNKLYHGKRKHLNMKKVVRPILSGENMGKEKNFIQFEIDPYIFLAFVYDIPFIDPYYKIYTYNKKLMSRNAIDDLPKKERIKKKIEVSEWERDGLTNCVIFVNFSTNPTDPETHEKLTGFHPSQVDRYYGDNDYDNKSKDDDDEYDDD